MTEANALLINLTHLSEGRLRTVKRELRVIIEDYAWKSMLSGCINVEDAGKELKKEIY